MQSFPTTIQQLNDWIYAIDQQMVRAFVLVGTQRALCLDTGVCAADLPAYIRQITSLPVSVCLTHSDHDHTANLAQFSEAYVHPAELPTLQGFSGVHFVPVAEGDVLDLGGKRLTVLACPGHTPGSIALLEADDKILFSGDTVSRGPVYLFGPGRQPDLYLSTLYHLREMARSGRFSAIYPNHNTCPIAPARIDDLIACTQGILDGTLDSVPAGLAMPGAEAVRLYRSGDCGIFYAPRP